MSGVRARRVKRNKALMAMYCPNGRVHGPTPPMDYYFKRYFRVVFEAIARKVELECVQAFHGSRALTFPVDIA
jgi:hypothetical protein